VINRVAARGELDNVIVACFEETATIGLRYQLMEGTVLRRRVETIEIAGEMLQVKIVERPGGIRLASSPLGPLTRTNSPSARTSTPLGMTTGIFPIRDTGYLLRNRSSCHSEGRRPEESAPRLPDRGRSLASLGMTAEVQNPHGFTRRCKGSRRPGVARALDGPSRSPSRSTRSTFQARRGPAESRRRPHRRAGPGAKPARAR